MFSNLGPQILPQGRHLSRSNNSQATCTTCKCKVHISNCKQGAKCALQTQWTKP